MQIRMSLGMAAALWLVGTAGAWAAAPDAALQAGQTPAGAGRAQGAGGRGGGGQGPARDTTTQTTPVGTASITGTVSNASNGAPVRRARVMLNGAELRGGRSATTDDQGRFAFQSLPAGRFTMTASKAGYVDLAYGAKRPGRPGTPIQVADGQKLDKISIALPRGSVVTGVVIDENGEPSPGTPVRVMRYVLRTGEKTLQQAGQDQTDDRGMYRIFGLQPGDYMVSAAPRNVNTGDLRQTLMAEVESLMAQAQGAGGRGAGAGGRGGAFDPNGAGGRGAQQLIDRANQIQQQLAQGEQEQAVAYAPVYYPGTTSASQAATVTLGIGEERSGIDFQLQIVPTARVEGTVLSASGALPAGIQVALSPSDRAGLPTIPGLGMNMTRVSQDGRFSFQGVTPGQYTLQARATIRQTDPATAQAGAAAPGAPGGGRGGGRGGPGGPGQIAQVLWASVDVGVGGTNLTDLVLNLQPGMTVSGRVDFQGSAQPPADLRYVRVSLSARGQQTFDLGGIPQGQVDASGHFTITGVPPGRYTITGNAPTGGQGQAAAGGVAAFGAPARGAGPGAAGGAGGSGWTLKSVVAGGRDALDFPLEIAPNQDVSNVIVQFTDKSQELSGTIQDSSGRPTSDFTIIVFPSDARYWLPQARRIVSARPGTDGRFTMRNLPPGDYRLTAVTDVEPGEWYDPAFLGQLGQASIPISIGEGEKKVQDIKVAGGGV